MLKLCSPVGRIPTEKHDCFVSALALGFSREYKKVHDVVSKHGRKIGARTPWAAVLGACKDFGLVFRRIEGGSKRLRNYPSRGSNKVVLVRGHAIALRNGDILDTSPSALNKIVRYEIVRQGE